MAVYQTTIVEHKEVAQDTIEVSLLRPAGFVFKAGQYIQLRTPELIYSDPKGSSRVFSIVSSPFDQEKLSVAFRHTGSGYKHSLVELPIDSPVSVEGPHGFITLPKEPSRALVFISGGIGITPHLSMIRSAVKSRYEYPITLLYANRNKESATYLKELQTIASHNKFLTLKNRFGRVDEQFIRQNVKDDARQCAWYIAGPPAMVDQVRNILSLLGVDSGQMFFEEFTGYE